MNDNVDTMISEYLRDEERQPEFDSVIARLFTSLVINCPNAITSGRNLSVSSAVAALRRSAAMPRSELAQMFGVDEVELGHWELGLRKSFSRSDRLLELLHGALRVLSGAPVGGACTQPSTIPTFAFARSSTEIRDRDPIVGAVNKAKVRAKYRGTDRALTTQKCNWYQHIAHQAEDVLSTYAAMRGSESVSLPVPVDLIAETLLGLEYYHERMAIGESGWFDPAARRICINRSESPTRRRYTLGHEIGHAVMHLEQLGGKVHRDTATTIDESRVELTAEVLEALTANDLISARAEAGELHRKASRETEANVFAATLVMPTQPLCDLIQGGIDESSELAEKFGVSIPAMEWRLRFLDACMGMPEAKPQSKGQGSLDLGD